MKELATKELSARTWPDFVKFFSQGNSWDHCGCTAWQGFRAPPSVRKWADKRDWTLEVKRRLVERDLAHGILVYSYGEPIGWCQYGPKGELPLPRAQRTELLTGESGSDQQRVGADASPSPAARAWKVTCFCTRKDFARRGIAGAALRAALSAIRTRGGGVVEAFPVVLVPESDPRLVAARQGRQELLRLIRQHGRFSDQVEQYMSSRPKVRIHPRRNARVPVSVEGIGAINGTGWVYGYMYPGTLAMFEREGFVPVAQIDQGPCVKVQTTLRPHGGQA
jgi:hypothetical protein